MNKYYLDKEGVKVLWTKTKEEIAAVDDKAVLNATNIEELAGKVATLEANGYDDTEVRGLIDAKLDKTEFQEAWEQHTADINHLSDAKANAADVYTKTEADGLLAAKANVADVETKADAAAKLTEAKDYTDAAIESLLGEDVSEAYDTFKEIQTYIETHGTEAQGMVASINQNTADIEALNTKVDDIQALTADEINEILNPVVLITFSLRGQYTCQAKEGMTWREFVDSTYNSGKLLTIEYNEEFNYEYIYCPTESANVEVEVDSVIVDGTTYGMVS